MDKLDKGFLVFSIICFFALGFCISQIIGTDEINKPIFEESNIPNSIPNSEQEIVNNCKNLSLRDSAYCLRDNVEIFYNYTITDDEIAKSMTLDDIKELGTDCGGYSYLYERLARDLGLNSTTNRYDGIKDVHFAHRWAVVWDNKLYCELDLLKVNCWEIDYE